MPFICVAESPEIKEIVKVLEVDTVRILQSRITTFNVALPFVAVIGDAGYTSEYQELGTPEPVEQLGFPELLLLLLLLLEGALVGVGLGLGVGAGEGLGVGITTVFWV